VLKLAGKLGLTLTDHRLKGQFRVLDPLNHTWFLNIAFIHEMILFMPTSGQTLMLNFLLRGGYFTISQNITYNSLGISLSMGKNAYRGKIVYI